MNRDTASLGEKEGNFTDRGPALSTTFYEVAQVSRVHERPQDITTPATAEGGPGTLIQNGGYHATGEQQGQIKQTCSEQKPTVRWPGPSEVKELSCINDEFKGISEGSKGTGERKLNHTGEVIYNNGMESYGVCQTARKKKQGQAKSR